eukprot:14816105-Alexandrium_andersonii.AAC.1
MSTWGNSSARMLHVLRRSRRALRRTQRMRSPLFAKRFTPWPVANMPWQNACSAQVTEVEQVAEAKANVDALNTHELQRELQRVEI